MRPGLVLTCAHVVSGLTQVEVTWGDRFFSGSVLSRWPAERGAGEYWAFPDLALVQIDAVPDQPSAWLDDTPVRSGDTYSCFGFSLSTPSAGVERDRLRVEAVGEAGTYIRVRSDQIVPGLSGSLVLNERTGLVAGIVKASRDTGNVSGGWIIPAEVITSTLAAIDLPLPSERPPNDVWLAPRLSRIEPLLRAQIDAAQELPYRLLDGPLPRLSDIYIQQEGENELVGRTTLDDALAGQRHVLLVGDPGSGKSSLLRHVCAETARWWRNGGGPPPFGRSVAVRISASALAVDRSFLGGLSQGVHASLSSHLDDDLPVQLFSGPLAPGIDWLVLVDGLDEIVESSVRSRVTSTLTGLIKSDDPRWRFVMTTRPLQAEEIGDLAKAVTARYRLCAFDRIRVNAFITGWFEARAGEIPHQDKTEQRFREWIASNDLGELITNPLMLTLCVIVFEIGGEVHELPTSVVGIYDEFIKTLLYHRQTRPPLREQLLQRLHSLDPSHALLVAESMVAGIEEMLETVAHEWYFESTTSIIDLANRWCRARLPSDTTTHHRWPAVLRFALIETGVLTEAGREVQWLHLSIAESLASKRLAGGVPFADWSPLLGSYSTANIVRLAALRLGSEPHRRREIVLRLAPHSAHDRLTAELIRQASPTEVARYIRRARHCIWFGWLFFIRFKERQLVTLRESPVVDRYVLSALESRWVPVRRKIAVISSDYRRSSRGDAWDLTGFCFRVFRSGRYRRSLRIKALRVVVLNREALPPDMAREAARLIADRRTSIHQTSRVAMATGGSEGSSAVRGALMTVALREFQRPLPLWFWHGRLRRRVIALNILENLKLDPLRSEYLAALREHIRSSGGGLRAVKMESALDTYLVDLYQLPESFAQRLVDEAIARYETNDLAGAMRSLDDLLSRRRFFGRSKRVSAALRAAKVSPRAARFVLIELLRRKAVGWYGARRLRRALETLGGVPPELQ